MKQRRGYQKNLIKVELVNTEKSIWHNPIPIDDKTLYQSI